MTITQFSLNNVHVVIASFFVLCVLGVISFLTMPRAEDPQFEYPASIVKIVAPGLIPLDIEKLIIDPLEEEINELDAIKKIDTSIEDSLATMRVEFLHNADPDQKYNNLVTAINRHRHTLPSNITHLDIQKISPTEVNIIQLALTSKRGDYQLLRHHAENIENDLEAVGGVKRVDISGLPVLEVEILVDPESIFGLGISLIDVKRSISSAGQNLSGGYVVAGGRRFTVKTSGDFDSIDDIRQVPIYGSSGQKLYLSDIAQVSISKGLPSGEAKYQGETAVFLSIVKQKDTNIFSIVDSVYKVLSDYEEKLPGAIALHTVFDQSHSVQFQINSFITNLFLGLVLVMVLCLIVLGRSMSFVIACVIPLCIFSSVVFIDALGFALQQMVIVGLIVSLGLLVDNAIVVLENISKFEAAGASKIEAVSKGTSQVSMAIFCGTATTVLAFIPMLFLPGSSGLFIQALPVTVIFCLSISLLMALSLTPVLSNMFYKGSAGTYAMFKRWSAGYYLPVLTFILNHKMKVLLLFFVALFFALSLFSKVGLTLFPRAEKEIFLVDIELPVGTELARTREVAEASAALIQTKLPGIKDIAINIGISNPRVYYNVYPNKHSSDFAQLLIIMHEPGTKHLELAVDRVRKLLENVPGAEFTVKEFVQGPAVDAPVAVRIVGLDIEEIVSVSKLVSEQLKAIPGSMSVRNQADDTKLDMQVTIDRDDAHGLGVFIDDIDRMIKMSLVGDTLGDFIDEDGKDYPIKLRLFSPSLPNVNLLEKIHLSASSGELVPLTQVADISLQNSVPFFQHYNTVRSVSVTALVKKGHTPQEVIQALFAKLSEQTWPENINFVVAGEEAEREDVFSDMLKVGVFVLLCLVGILVIQFKSFAQPLIIFVTVPFSIAGAVIALYSSGNPFSFPAFIGIVALFGIVTNNAILLIDNANQKRNNANQKYNTTATAYEAVLEASTDRFLPISLTTITTVLGVLPITLSGSSMWAPMGWVLIGGLLVSTLASLTVVPIFYVLVEKFSRSKFG